MKGKDHTPISITWAFLITSPIIITHPTYFVAFLVGVLIGSLLPDDDSSVSPFKGKGPLMEGIGYAVSVVAKITCILFKKIKADPNNEYEKHRGLLHSVPGVFVASLLLAIPFNILVYLLGYWNSGIIVLSIGIFAGTLFHLLEDCCTCSGVRLFFPYSEKKLRGGINTRLPDNYDKRPQEYASMFALFAVGLLVYEKVVQKSPLFAKYNYFGELTQFQLLAIAIGLSILAWVIMFLWSQYPINCNRGDGSKNPKFDNVTSMKPKSESTAAKVMTKNIWTGNVRENHTVDKFSATKSRKESKRGEKMARKTWTEDGRTNRSGDGSSTRRIKKITIEYEDIDYESDRKKSSRDDPYAKFVKRNGDMGKKIWGGSGHKKSTSDNPFAQFEKVDKEMRDMSKKIWGGSGHKKSTSDNPFAQFEKVDKEMRDMSKKIWGGTGSKKSSRGGVSSTNPKKGSTSSKSNRWRI